MLQVGLGSVEAGRLVCEFLQRVLEFHNAGYTHFDLKWDAVVWQGGLLSVGDLSLAMRLMFSCPETLASLGSSTSSRREAWQQAMTSGTLSALDLGGGTVLSLPELLRGLIMHSGTTYGTYLM
jgi:hypothetical protein